MENKILIVDDEPQVIQALRRSLLEEPYEVHGARNGQEALQRLRSIRFKVVISDEKMPEMTGSEFLSTVRERYPGTVRILLTGQASPDSTMKAVNRGEIYRFFVKPWNDLELKLALRSALEKYDLELENRRLLATVKRQAINMKLLEKRYPGIDSLKRDPNGSILLPEISEAEYREILAQCEREYA